LAAFDMARILQSGRKQEACVTVASEVCLKVGDIVVHPNKPEWGPGKILALEPPTAAVYFRDYAEEKPGDAIRRIRIDLIHLHLAGEQQDPWLDNLPPYQDGSLGLLRPRLTFEQALRYFTRKFPLGFADPSYIGNGRDTGERGYKLEIHHAYLKQLGAGAGEGLLQYDDIAELSARAKAVVSKINILHVQEKITFRAALDQTVTARRFFSTFFRLLAEGPTRIALELYFDAVNAFGSGERRATWTMATVLPYLADPNRFMFMKPEVTQQIAERLAYDLDYRSQPNWATYDRLLRMSWLLFDRLQYLGAQDLLDVQSFIYVVRDATR
jgi:hypothetical protein